MKKTALGRGLGSLLPDNEEMLRGAVLDISLKDIDPNRDQPRKSFPEETLKQLADSIREQGILQPLLVISEGGRYRIVAGERRFRAARIAGLDTVPCIVRDMDHIRQMEATLIENLQREDLNPMESAQAIRALMQQCGYTQEAAAERLGKSRPVIANLLRLLSLPEEVQRMIRKGELSQGHAKVLAGVSGLKRQTELARRCVAEKLNVRQLEKLAADASGRKRANPVKPVLPPELRYVEERMMRAFGVRASMTGDRKQGRILLKYNTADELDHIFEVLNQFGDA